MLDYYFDLHLFCQPRIHIFYLVCSSTPCPVILIKSVVKPCYCYYNYFYNKLNLTINEFQPNQYVLLF